jgi:hypothetical protein
MKIFRYHPETGCYLGEDFADENPIQRGSFIIPDDATNISPPHVERGEYPVFNVQMKRWEVHVRPDSARISLYARLNGDGESGVSL